MNGSHPNAKRAAACALAALALLSGCRSSSSVASNPFMGPDRVAPPSTRMLAPGQAQPYYQGDPLPVMQSSTAAPVAAPLATDSTSRTESGKTLAWNAPNGAPAAATTNRAPNLATAPAPRPASPWDRPSSPPTAIAATAEPPVSVPGDADALHFAPPAAAPASEPQVAATAAVSPPGVAPPATPSALTAPPNQGVSLASYNAPVAASGGPGLTPITTTPERAHIPAATSPWQKPPGGTTSMAPQPSGVAAQPSAIYPAGTALNPLAAQPVYTVPQSPAALPTNTMAVSLRSVPSPEPQPGDPLPRVRIPGYDMPQTANADGFRPRTSMR